MAIDYDRLFEALGKLCGGLNEWNTARGSELDARVAELRTQLVGIGPDLDDSLTASRNTAVGAGDSWVGYLANAASNALRTEVLNDRPLTDTGFGSCLAELVRQMTIDGQSLATSPATVGSVTAIGSPVGTPRFLVSDLDPITGAASNFVLPDVYIVTATAPTVFSVSGKSAVRPTDPTWPTGTGVNTSVTQIDASATSLGADPGFETWSGSPAVPTFWTTVAGTPGTTVAQATDTPVTGAGTLCLQLLGDGSTLRVRQLVSVTPNTVYAVHAFLKRTANPANTGTLTVTLRDGAGNALGTGVSVATSAAATSWTASAAAIATPASLPSEVYLEVRYNGGVGDTIRVDQAALVELPALYPVGLRLAVFRSATANTVGDARSITVTRSNPSLSFIRSLDRLLSLTSYTTRIPTSGSPTQADALVS